MDATLRPRPGGMSRRSSSAGSRASVRRPMLADVDCSRPALAAAPAGAPPWPPRCRATRATARRRRSPTWSWCGCWCGELDCPVLAEGRYASPESVRAAFDAGAWAVVVGTAITDPGRAHAPVRGRCRGGWWRALTGVQACRRACPPAARRARPLREILEALVASLEPGARAALRAGAGRRYGLARMTVAGRSTGWWPRASSTACTGAARFVAEPRVAQAMCLQLVQRGHARAGDEARLDRALAGGDRGRAVPGRLAGDRARRRGGRDRARAHGRRRARGPRARVPAAGRASRASTRPTFGTGRCSSCCRALRGARCARPTSAWWPWRSSRTRRRLLGVAAG